MSAVLDARGAVVPETAWTRLPVATPGLVVNLDILDGNLDEMAGIAHAPASRSTPTPRPTAWRSRRAADRASRGGALRGEARRGRGLCRRRRSAPVRRQPDRRQDKAARALALHRTTDLLLATDGVEAAATIGAVFAAAGERARVMLAIDSGLGREGVSDIQAPDVAAAIHAIPGIELVGIYTHEGHTYAATDPADLVVRARAVGEFMVAVAGAIRARGVALPIVSLGASASARAVAHVPGGPRSGPASTPSTT